MFRYCFDAVNNQSGNPMRWHGIGLTLSYSFLGYYQEIFYQERCSASSYIS